MNYLDDLRTNAGTVNVAIGSFKRSYKAIVTTAPNNYDGFGTLDLSEYYLSNGRPARIVLIEDDHFYWQVGRYSSGIYSSEVTEHETIAGIEIRLMEKFMDSFARK